MLSFLKKLFGTKAPQTTETAVVTEAPYKVETPVVEPVVATPVAEPVVKSKPKAPKKPEAKKPVAKKPAQQKAPASARPKKPKAPKA